MTVLVLSPRYSEDSIAISKVAAKAGWEVERLPSWHIPPLLREEDTCVFAEPLFAINAASQLDIELIEPTYDWLIIQPSEYVRREVTLMTLGDARRLALRGFVKSAGEKFFRPQVYRHADELPSSEVAPDSFPILVSEPVEWEVEFRLFVLEGRCVAMSPYLRNGKLARDDQDVWAVEKNLTVEATEFASMFLSDARTRLPPAVVVDIGKIAGRGWALVEANAVWGSGIYGCDPRAVLPAIKRSCVKAECLIPADHTWIIDHMNEDFT